jgi:hypothetical protein
MTPNLLTELLAHEVVMGSGLRDIIGSLEPCKAEIGELTPVVDIKEDVVRLEVIVHNVWVAKVAMELTILASSPMTSSSTSSLVSPPGTRPALPHPPRAGLTSSALHHSSSSMTMFVSVFQLTFLVEKQKAETNSEKQN